MNKSIEGFKIYNRPIDYQRMVQLIRYFQVQNPPTKFSYFLNRPIVQQKGFEQSLDEITEGEATQVQIIAYCLMPTHFHILVKQLKSNGVSEYLRKIQNSYARYFNTKYKRKGPLWMSKFQNVPIKTDEQLLHVHRYIHLNPTSAGITKKPEQWEYSSYREYITPKKIKFRLTNPDEMIRMNPLEYKKFTENQQDYQQSLAIIKKEILE